MTLIDNDPKSFIKAAQQVVAERAAARTLRAQTRVAQETEMVVLTGFSGTARARWLSAVAHFIDWQSVLDRWQ